MANLSETGDRTMSVEDSIMKRPVNRIVCNSILVRLTERFLAFAIWKRNLFPEMAEHDFKRKFAGDVEIIELLKTSLDKNSHIRDYFDVIEVADQAIRSKTLKRMGLCVVHQGKVLEEYFLNYKFFAHPEIHDLAEMQRRYVEIFKDFNEFTTAIAHRPLPSNFRLKWQLEIINDPNRDVNPIGFRKEKKPLDDSRFLLFRHGKIETIYHSCTARSKLDLQYANCFEKSATEITNKTDENQNLISCLCGLHCHLFKSMIFRCTSCKLKHHKVCYGIQDEGIVDRLCLRCMNALDESELTPKLNLSKQKYIMIMRAVCIICIKKLQFTKRLLLVLLGGLEESLADNILEELVENNVLHPMKYGKIQHYKVNLNELSEQIIRNSTI